MRRTAPSMLSPRAKTHNYLNMIMAEKPVKALDPDAWAILLDENGNLAEGLGSNIFIVREGELLHAVGALRAAGRQPADDHRHGQAARHPVHAGDIDLFDAGQRRGDVPDLDQPLHPAGAQLQRRPGRRRQDAGPDHQEADRRLFQGASAATSWGSI